MTAASQQIISTRQSTEILGKDIGIYTANDGRRYRMYITGFNRTGNRVIDRTSEALPRDRLEIIQDLAKTAMEAIETSAQTYNLASLDISKRNHDYVISDGEHQGNAADVRIGQEASRSLSQGGIQGINSVKDIMQSIVNECNTDRIIAPPPISLHSRHSQASFQQPDQSADQVLANEPGFQPPLGFQNFNEESSVSSQSSALQENLFPAPRNEPFSIRERASETVFPLRISDHFELDESYQNTYEHAGLGPDRAILYHVLFSPRLSTNNDLRGLTIGNITHRSFNQELIRTHFRQIAHTQNARELQQSSPDSYEFYLFIRNRLEALQRAYQEQQDANPRERTGHRIAQILTHYLPESRPEYGYINPHNITLFAEWNYQ